MSLDWSPQQVTALDLVRRWLRDPGGPQVFKLEGYAGTGKTTIAVDIYNECNALACAYTGKAASVMANKGLGNASTVHRLIYTPVDKAGDRIKELKEELAMLEKVREPSRSLVQRMDAVRRALREATAAANQPNFVLKEASDIEMADLVILDEASMVDQRMAEDLLSFGVKVLVIGDPAQLPPVKGVGYFLDGRPDFRLTEIHRQAAGNPIIRMATDVREGRSLQLGDWGAARVVERITPQEALAADQILCGTNNKRRVINNRHRELEGYDWRAQPTPYAGERLVCLRNNRELGILNGTLWDVVAASWHPGEEEVDLRLTPDTGGAEIGLPAEACIFIDEDMKPQWGRHEWFTYGYCLTVHKSQGSQWNDVVLFDDWTNQASKRQWLYTGITRAAERLTVVRS